MRLTHFINFLYDLIVRYIQNLNKENQRVETDKDLEKEEDNMNAHHDYKPAKLDKKDHELLEKFKEENRIEENNWHYRKGAAYTASFGIADGWGPNMEPGYIRIHPGVDRAGGGEQSGIDDIVITPFNFDKTGFIDYGGRSYGSLIFLINEEYGFEMRIAHMHPEKDIIPWALKQFKNKKPYKQDWLIGSAGNYGYSTGAHTHTELISTGEKSDILELLLEERHGEEKINKEYSNEYIHNEYKKRSKFEGWTEGEILEHWKDLKKDRRIFFINDYKFCFYWKDRPYTRYATNMVFDGL